MSFGKELILSAEEALAIAKGEAKPDAVYVPPRVKVAAIRKKTRTFPSCLYQSVWSCSEYLAGLGIEKKVS